MEYKLYQLKNRTDYRFEDWKWAKENGFTISDYTQVYSGEIEKEHCLSRLWEIFNIYQPFDFRGHSMSVSDVVALKDEGSDRWHWYYCDDIGWEDITGYEEMLR